LEEFEKLEQELPTTTKEKER